MTINPIIGICLVAKKVLPFVLYKGFYESDVNSLINKNSSRGVFLK